MPPMAKTKRWEESLPRGFQVQALCIGVNGYKEETKLKNAIADAQGIAQFIENLPDSSARAVCRNPESKVALRREIEVARSPTSNLELQTRQVEGKWEILVEPDTDTFSFVLLPLLQL